MPLYQVTVIETVDGVSNIILPPTTVVLPKLPDPTKLQVVVRTGPTIPVRGPTS